MKRRVKKIKKTRVFIAIFILLIIILLVLLISRMPVLGYYVEGNKYYTDSQILKMTSLDKYPSYLFTTSIAVNAKVKNNPLIDSIKIKKTLLLKFRVIVKEKKILFYDLNNKESITDDMDKIDFYDKNSPILTNDIKDKDIYNSFIDKMKKVDDSILNSISEIKYDPNEIDKERFLVTMNDGNYIYLTLSKFKKINDYLKILSTLDNKNGILYLDYGNYFVPYE